LPPKIGSLRTAIICCCLLWNFFGRIQLRRFCRRADFTSASAPRPKRRDLPACLHTRKDPQELRCCVTEFNCQSSLGKLWKQKTRFPRGNTRKISALVPPLISLINRYHIYISQYIRADTQSQIQTTPAPLAAPGWF